MSGSCADCHNILPIRNIALPIFVIAHCHHSAVAFQAYRVTDFRTDRHNIRPVRDIALAISAIANRRHGAVAFQAYRVITICADRHNIRPVRDIALTIVIVSYRHHSAVAFQAYCVDDSRADHFPYCKAIPQFQAPHPGVLIARQSTKGKGRFRFLSARQQRLRFGILRFQYAVSTILIASQRLKSGTCLLILSIRQQALRLFVRISRNNNLRHQQRSGNNYHNNNYYNNGQLLFLSRGLLSLLFRNRFLSSRFGVNLRPFLYCPFPAMLRQLPAVLIVPQPCESFCQP